jgi:hypothetical protein
LLPSQIAGCGCETYGSGDTSKPGSAADVVVRHR